MSFQVERVVEAFSAEGTKIALHVAVAFHVSVQESLQAETLLADFALELAVLLRSDRLGLLGLGASGQVECQRVFDPVPSVDQFQRGVRRNAKLKIPKFKMSRISVFSISQKSNRKAQSELDLDVQISNCP